MLEVERVLAGLNYPTRQRKRLLTAGQNQRRAIECIERLAGEFGSYELPLPCEFVVSMRSRCTPHRDA